MAVNYGNVYVARIAMGASDTQTVRAFLEAEAWHGPSLVIAYSHCIAHGFDLRQGMQQQKRAADSGYWPLFRYNPAEAAAGRPPMIIDSRPPTVPFRDYAYRETRYRMLASIDPGRAERLLEQAQQDIDDRRHRMEQLAAPLPAAAGTGSRP